MDLCAAGGVYPPLHRHVLIQMLLHPSLLHSRVSPTRPCLPTWGAQSQTPGEGSASSSPGALPLGNQPLLAFVTNSLSMSVSLCLDLPRKHEGWSIMAGQYFYSRLISVDTIHIFSPVTQ